jgi:hypothetical protein
VIRINFGFTRDLWNVGEKMCRNKDDPVERGDLPIKSVEM